jgi:hypothetical protein
MIESKKSGIFSIKSRASFISSYRLINREINFTPEIDLAIFDLETFYVTYGVLRFESCIRLSAKLTKLTHFLTH